jgi:hypothetical protein
MSVHVCGLMGGYRPMFQSVGHIIMFFSLCYNNFELKVDLAFFIAIFQENKFFWDFIVDYMPIQLSITGRVGFMV